MRGFGRITSAVIYLTALFANIPASAKDLTLGEYRNPPNQAVRGVNLINLDGVKAGLVAYHVWLLQFGKPTFCIPAQLALTADQAESIMLRAAEKHSGKSDTPISVMLLVGMQDTFPCK
jgi:hypothetical protein